MLCYMAYRLEHINAANFFWGMDLQVPFSNKADSELIGFNATASPCVSPQVEGAGSTAEQKLGAWVGAESLIIHCAGAGPWALSLSLQVTALAFLARQC